MKVNAIFKYLAASILLFLAFNSQAIRVPPATNLEVVGFVRFEGKPLEHARVELRKGSCFGELSSFTWTDEKGYYRLFEPSSYDPLYVKVQEAERDSPYQSACSFEGVQFGSDHLNHQKKEHSISLVRNDQAGYPVQPKPFTKEQQAKGACKAKGGEWGELQPKQFACNLKFKDAGKTCTDANQCSSKVCFSYVDNYRWVANAPRPKPTGACAVDTYQALNRRPGEINGEFKAGVMIPYK